MKSHTAAPDILNRSMNAFPPMRKQIFVPPKSNMKNPSGFFNRPSLFRRPFALRGKNTLLWVS